MCPSFSSALWPTTRQVARKSITKKFQTRKSPDRQNVFLSFFFFFFFFFLFKIAWLFHNGFSTKQKHFTLSSVPAHRFLRTSKSYKAVNKELWLHFQCTFFTCMHAHLYEHWTLNLEPYQWHVIIIFITKDHCSSNVVGVFGNSERLSSIVDSVFEQVSS